MAVVAAVILAAPASAQTCLQNEYNLVNKQKLNCTANDVQIAEVTNIRNPTTGAALTSCDGGTNFNFIADFKIVTTSDKERENVGLYIATDSRTQALTGSCVDNIISPQHPCSAGSNILCGSDNYHDSDGPNNADNCGDTSSNDLSPTFGAKAEKVTLLITNFACTAPAGSTTLVLPNCTSWQEPGGSITCSSPSPSFPYPVDANSKPEAIPGSPSKCNCSVIPLPITVQSPSITVKKTCNTVDNQQAPNFTTSPPTPNSCTIHPEGGTVTYTVSIANTSNFGNIVVDQICDSAYGNIFTVAGFSGPACAVGSAGSKTGTTCGALTVAAGSSSTCTFTADQPEELTINNIASVKGHGTQGGSTFGPTQSNQVTVVSNEAPTTGTITKQFVANTAACATVRYSVEVKNTSQAGTDEILNLSAFNDSAFGSITSVHGTGNNAVLGTTCAVATNASGLGTLSGSSGAGGLPTTIPVNGGTYTCQFDAQICGGLDTDGCFTHYNEVSATLTGDEGANDTVSLTPGKLNVKECVVGSVIANP